MAQFTVVLVTALLIDTFSYCSAENVYCVIPATTPCSSCPHDSTHYTTLSEYAQEAELYFTSNTTMVFLPGDHTLDTSITVANVDRLTMRGETSLGKIATVVCSGAVGLSFTRMVEFKMYFLAFTSCSRYAFLDHMTTPVYAAMYLQSTQYAELVNCSFHDNNGTALLVDNANITLAGNTEFTHNKACGNIIGGAIIAVSSNLTFTGNTTFLGNSAISGQRPFLSGSGGAIYTSDTVLRFSGTNNFINNSAGEGGGVILAHKNTVLRFSGTNNFINNSAIEGGVGGVIWAYENTVLNFSGTNNFINNSADKDDGGVIWAKNTVLNFSGTNFINNSADTDGGVIWAHENTVLNFSGTNNFINNSAGDFYGGVICAFKNTVLNFSGTNNFINNSAGEGGGVISASESTVLYFSGTNNFINNSASVGGAIFSEPNNTLTFSGIIYFTNNGEFNTFIGGGVYLGLKSTLTILPNTIVYWENNHAHFGGAIYVADVSTMSYCTLVAKFVPKEECFFQLRGQNLSNGIDVQFVFKNNFAGGGGSVLYGGAIDNCILTGLDSNSSGKVFDMIVHNNDTDDNTTSTISSDPLRICYCENNLPDCDLQHPFAHTVYPGETFQISVVAVGQRDGTVPSTVISIIEPGYPGHLPDSQHLQQANNTCTKLNYTVLSLSQNVFIKLNPESSPCSDFANTNTKLYISVSLHQNCPPGFSISELEKSCVCQPRLTHYTNSCSITNGVGQITRKSGEQFWIGYDDQSQSDEKLILHPFCPYSYCVNHEVTLPLNESDMQCAYNRSGLLCGACKEGHSLVLGTSHCRKCPNDYNLALLISFAVMGVALIFFLLVCKLTVATGMFSGLVFYANIIGPNRTIFLPVKSTNGFSIFIAWLNLDFGIETCFYNGVDVYSKTWLQFVFPVYIWVLVGLMILLSHYSRRFANMLGNNPVSVLATLILLSYAKILRTMITALYITYLEYPTYNRIVWLYDANIDYLVGKHIPLFIVAVLVFFFLFLPYTFLLLFGQWLQAISHLRLFSWVNSARLKPFMDSYHAPYKAKHRYWPGLLLVLRFVLLLVFAFNIQQDPSVNLLAILVGTGMLQLWAWVSGGVYKNWCLDALEGSFALNLIVIAAATSYVDHSQGNQLAVGYTSVSIALATFIGILVFQLANVTGITQYLKRKCTALKLAIRNQAAAEGEVEPLDNDLPDRLINPEEYEPPFHTPQGHATAELTGANEAQRRLLAPVYTYGSIN